MYTTESSFTSRQITPTELGGDREQPILADFGLKNLAAEHGAF